MLPIFPGLNTSPWGLCLGAAALCALAVTLLRSQKEYPLALGTWIAGVLGALLGSHLVWCFCRWNSLPGYAGGYSLLWKPWLGGHCLIGAVCGGMLFVSLWAAIRRRKPGEMTDLALPGALLALCIARLAEVFTGQGLSSAIFDSFAGEEAASAWMGFPFTIPLADPEWEEYITWHIPVFFYEALAALALLIFSLCRRKRTSQPGQMTGTVLVILSACQILLEQLRNDDCLRFGFVRVTQIAAMAAILAVLLLRMLRHLRAHTLNIGHLLRLLTLILCAAVIIFVEFAFEKPLMVPWLRISMLVCACMSACCILDRTRRTHARAWIGIVSAALIVLLTITAVCLLSAGDDHALLLYGIMAAACAGAAAAALPALPDDT